MSRFGCGAMPWGWLGRWSARLAWSANTAAAAANASHACAARIAPMRDQRAHVSVYGFPAGRVRNSSGRVWPPSWAHALGFSRILLLTATRYTLQTLRPSEHGHQSPAGWRASARNLRCCGDAARQCVRRERCWHACMLRRQAGRSQGQWRVHSI